MTAPSGGIWAWHPKPKGDELLSSWLVRAARDYEIKLHSFTKLLCGNIPVWNRDVDRLAPQPLLDALAEKFGVDPVQVRETTLPAFEGQYFRHHNPNGNTPWILSLGLYHRVRLKQGLQFCPHCLGDDLEPHYRRRWRLAFVTTCPIHRVLLATRCPNCRQPVNFHRVPYKQPSIRFCYKCGYDLAATERAMLPDEPLVNALLELQEALVVSRRSGHVAYGTISRFAALDVFDVLRRLMGLTTFQRQTRRTKQRVEHLRAVIGETTDIPNTKKSQIENADVLTRFIGMRCAAWLLREWPNRFVELSQQCDIYSSDFLRDMTYSPPWFESVVRDQLFDPRVTEGHPHRYIRKNNPHKGDEKADSDKGSS